METRRAAWTAVWVALAGGGCTVRLDPGEPGHVGERLPASPLTDVVDGVASEILDADNDGYESGLDCDDADPAVHPGTIELCDDVDNDCDPSTGEAGLVSANGAAYATVADAIAHTPQGGVVDVCEGVFPGTFSIGTSITLRGRGAGLTILDGRRARTTITVTDADPVIEDLTITGGSTSGAGGGLTVEGRVVELRRVEIVGNEAEYGGGLHVTDGTVWLEDVTIADNEAHISGGGVEVSVNGEFHGIRVRIEGNVARIGGGAYVGATQWRKPIVCTDCNVETNVAELHGGGIYVDGGGGGITTMELVGGTVRENVAGWAGGVFLCPGHAELIATDVDFGVGVTENLPDDVRWNGGVGGSIGWFGAHTTASCDAMTGC